MELNELKAKITIIVNEEESNKIREFLKVKDFDVKIYYKDKQLSVKENKK